MSDPNYQSLETGTGPGVAVRKSSVGGGRMLALVLAVLGFGLIGYFLFIDDGAQVEPSEPPQGEEFVPVRSPQQQAFVPPPPPEIPTVTVPTAPPPPPPPPPAEQAPVLEAAPVEVREPDCEENATDKATHPKCIELERQRKLLERIRSNVVVIDAGNAGTNAAAMAGGGNGVAGDGSGMEGEDGAGGSGNGSGGGRVADADRAFLSQMGGAGFETSVANKNKRPDAWIPQGSMIRGTLETAINSDLAGMVKAIVRQDVYSFDGRRILIPAGSSLVGDYKTGVTRGQERIFIVWTRMIRADGVSVQLGSYGTDALGRSGLTGKVDRKYWERFGPPALLTMVGGFAQYVAALGDDNGNQNVTVIDSSTGNVISVPSSNNSSGENPKQIAAETVAAGIQQMAAEAFKDSNSIQPTIHVDQGAEINVFVTRDLDFSDLYPDPVRQEFERLRKARIRK
ncbi:type IV secretion system protein VirB10 [Phyllobacterium sophorae]|uniref:Conjugal transfer protein TrbI n=1 Tax=Phyllobacterium sophorae TaxID=1520277 RepID=A0A2P7B3C9_9HYPH|nr:type IV secretion system protein VirB10 [Phyllobacterium sophorae]PSH60973.1 conjugal transfer protein TrbI [Phyllobacterium sophorae]